ncbi:MAG: hypothetical protein QXN37_01350 [Candidatus Anstonellaceae archaeon]
MQEILEKKEEKQKAEVPTKSFNLSLKHANLSTEGLMEISQESQRIEKMGRESFEKSVKIELDEIKKHAHKKKKKASKKKSPKASTSKKN